MSDSKTLPWFRKVYGTLFGFRLYWGKIWLENGVVYWMVGRVINERYNRTLLNEKLIYENMSFDTFSTLELELYIWSHLSITEPYYLREKLCYYILRGKTNKSSTVFQWLPNAEITVFFPFYFFIVVVSFPVSCLAGLTFFIHMTGLDSFFQLPIN